MDFKLSAYIHLFVVALQFFALAVYHASLSKRQILINRIKILHAEKYVQFNLIFVKY